MNDRMRNKGRSAIYGMAGIYLLYLAYEIFKTRADISGIEFVLVMIVAAAFLLLGIGLLGFGFYNIYKIQKEERKAAEELEDK